MWILLVLAGLVLVLARAMRAAADRAANEVAAAQAAAVEQGAVQYVLASVDGLSGQVPSETDTPCEAVQVGGGAFWILRPAGADQTTYSYGIVDEASKVNLNQASLEMLSRLPAMTSEFAASIVDWRDSDSDVTPGGAENEYYLMLADPCECKNSSLETVEELFLVRGATKDIIYGQDVNRNGVIDPGESASPLGGAFSTSGARLYQGIINYVTVYSAGAPAGQLVNVNDRQSAALSDMLRQAVSSDRLPGVLDRVRRERPFKNVMDFYFRAGLSMGEFRQVAGRITTSTGAEPKGLINVNTAPKEVLLCLPGLEESDVSALLAQRPTAEADRTSIAWVAEALPRAKAVAVGGLITGRSYQFSADIVSVPAGGRAFRRCRVVIDARSSPPKVVYRQNLTHLGWPLAPEIITLLRSGTPLESMTQTVARKVG
jgi:type II secretory pathway component PulK